MAVRLFVGNMPYGATEADLRTHFSAVGEPSHIVIPVDRDTGRPRGFAFVEFLDRGLAEQAVQRFDQQPFMGRSLSVSEARPREERPAGGFRPPGAGGYPPRPGGPAGGFGGPPRPGGGGFSGPPRPGGPGAFRSSGPPGAGSAAPGRNFGPPKKKSAGNEKRWDAKERGPKGPIKERYTGRLGGLYDDPTDEVTEPESLTDFDDIASKAADEEGDS
ncbi:MAG: RNA-binding protein [Vicinamibacterales bacterium]